MIPPLSVALLNAAGNAELNIPDAPQSLDVVLTNRSPVTIHTTALGSARGLSRRHVQLRFRPDTLRRPEAIRVAPEASRRWGIEAVTDEDGTQLVLLRALHRRTWSAAESEVVRLVGVSASPAGGTRATRVAVEVERIEATAGPAPGPGAPRTCWPSPSSARRSAPSR